MGNLNIYSNWRIHVLAIIAITGLMLILGETEDILSLILSKLAGFTLFYLCYRLGKRWDKVLSEITE